MNVPDGSDRSPTSARWAHGPKGGKFLLLPPGYKGSAPRSGYHVLQGTMNNYNAMARSVKLPA